MATIVLQPKMIKIKQDILSAINIQNVKDINVIDNVVRGLYTYIETDISNIDKQMKNIKSMIKKKVLKKDTQVQIHKNQFNSQYIQDCKDHIINYIKQINIFDTT